LRRRAAGQLVATLTLLVAAACAGAPTSPAPTAPASTDQPPLPTPDLASPTSQPTPTPGPVSPTPTPTPVPTPIALPSPTSGPPQVGLPADSCVDGWQSPVVGSDKWSEGLEMLGLEMGLDSGLEVDEMRYFTGPDVPWIIEPHYPVVERWYIKARQADDASFAGRWLLEARTDRVRGISAVAPHDTVGFASPDWVGFFGEGPPRAYPDLPGTWAGIPYDFVTGEGDGGQPGLPDEVVGCLDDIA
jgi:hypothetical protein